MTEQNDSATGDGTRQAATQDASARPLAGRTAVVTGGASGIGAAHGLRASPFKSAHVTAKHGLEGLA